jgi:hypothetical protein
VARSIAAADKFNADDDRNAAYCREVTALGWHCERRAEERRSASGAIDDDRIAVQAAIWFEALGGEVEREDVYPTAFGKLPREPLGHAASVNAGDFRPQTDSHQSLSSNGLISVRIARLLDQTAIVSAG